MIDDVKRCARLVSSYFFVWNLMDTIHTRSSCHLLPKYSPSPWQKAIYRPHSDD